MGQDYSMCMGYERNKQPKQSMSFQHQLVDTWPNQGIATSQNNRVMMGRNEAYIIKKQESLNLHLIPCTKLKQRFEQLCEGDFEKSISQTELCAILVNCKLLRADFPRNDPRWQNFYAKFIVVDESEVGQNAQRYYALTPSLIALIALSQGSADVKAKAICELFSGRRFLKPAPLGIRAPKTNREGRSEIFSENTLAGRPSMEEPTKMARLTKDQLHCIVSIIVNVSLTLLPLYASDVDQENRRTFVRTLIQWHQRSESCVQTLIQQIKAKAMMRETYSGQSSLITVRQLVDAAKSLDLFNVVMIRELAKRTQVISDINPNINRETALERDLFHTSRQTVEHLNETLTDAQQLDIPTIEAEAVLYRFQFELAKHFETEKQDKVKNGRKSRKALTASANRIELEALGPRGKTDMKGKDSVLKPVRV